MGHLASHMLQHLVLMNLLVPLGVLLWARHIPFRALWRSWPWATAAQIVLLWSWHSPGALNAAMSDMALMVMMHLSLTAAAAWFWSAIAVMPRDGSWRALFALLVTGKLFCLLGALLVFAPNLLFDIPAAHHHAPASTMLADQQLAGMLMLVVCPLSYVAVGIVLASRWFLSLDQDEEAHA